MMTNKLSYSNRGAWIERNMANTEGISPLKEKGIETRRAYLAQLSWQYLANTKGFSSNTHRSQCLLVVTFVLDVMINEVLSRV